VQNFYYEPWWPRGIERISRPRSRVSNSASTGSAKSTTGAKWSSVLGCHNRIMSLKALARAARDRTTVGVLVLDLDGFKQVNDQFGHRAGDEVLVVAAARLRDQIRDADLAARLGGDEFAVLLPDLGSVEKATTIARRIITALGEPIRVGTATVAVSVSVGSTTWSAAWPSADPVGQGRRSPPKPEALLHDADTAMYLAKSRGAASRSSPATSQPSSRPPDPIPTVRTERQSAPTSA
jgi:diguanylate cyclase (GGDEF)-like protein